MVDQITVFLENSKGRLNALARTLADAEVNMHMLTIADTADYGLVRIIVGRPDKALEVLTEQGYRVMKTKVSAIVVPDKPGGLADLLDTLDELNLNIEYGYCFTQRDGTAVDIVKIHDAGDTVRAVAALEQAGFKVLTQEDL